jgi:hypothetical protein
MEEYSPRAFESAEDFMHFLGFETGEGEDPVHVDISEDQHANAVTVDGATLSTASPFSVGATQQPPEVFSPADSVNVDDVTMEKYTPRVFESAEDFMQFIGFDTVNNGPQIPQQGSELLAYPVSDQPGRVISVSGAQKSYLYDGLETLATGVDPVDDELNLNEDVFSKYVNTDEDMDLLDSGPLTSSLLHQINELPSNASSGSPLVTPAKSISNNMELSAFFDEAISQPALETVKYHEKPIFPTDPAVAELDKFDQMYEWAAATPDAVEPKNAAMSTPDDDMAINDLFDDLLNESTTDESEPPFTLATAPHPFAPAAFGQSETTATPNVAEPEPKRIIAPRRARTSAVPARPPTVTVARSFSNFTSDKVIIVDQGKSFPFTKVDTLKINRLTLNNVLSMEDWDDKKLFDSKTPTMTILLNTGQRRSERGNAFECLCMVLDYGKAEWMITTTVKLVTTQTRGEDDEAKKACENDPY